MSYRVDTADVASERTGAADPEAVAVALAKLANNSGGDPVTFGVVGSKLLLLVHLPAKGHPKT